MSGFCIAVAPNAVASRTPSHGSTGTGGRHRSSPTGAAANGIPANRNPCRAQHREPTQQVVETRRHGGQSYQAQDAIVLRGR